MGHLRVHDDGGGQEREGEAVPEFRPSLTLSRTATQLRIGAWIFLTGLQALTPNWFCVLNSAQNGFWDWGLQDQAPTLE